MENFKKIKKIVIILGVLFALNLILFALMLPSLSLWSVSVIVVQVVIVIYFVGICFALLREIEERDKKEKSREK